MKKEETAEKEKKTTDGFILNADKHSPASSARSTKRRVRGGCLCQWELKAPTDRSRSDCVHEQVAKQIANVRFTSLKKKEMHSS